MVKIDVISGFLGAGKTTLINRLLADAYTEEKPVLIENEFGDVSVDDSLIGDPDIQIRVLSSGCVCCTLKGDLILGINEVVREYSPTRIIIEPTGLADPEDVLSVCMEICETLPAQLGAFITIANAENVLPLLDVGGTLFLKQISEAKLLLLNRTNLIDADELNETLKAIQELCPDCIVLEEGDTPMEGLAILALAEEAAARSIAQHQVECGSECHHDHDHDHDCAHDHDHDHGVKRSFENFTSLSFFPDKIYCAKDIDDLFDSFRSGNAGLILRAKGFLNIGGGKSANVQYVYGRGEVHPTSYSGSPKLVIIGSGLDANTYERLVRAKRLTEFAPAGG